MKNSPKRSFGIENLEDRRLMTIDSGLQATRFEIARLASVEIPALVASVPREAVVPGAEAAAVSSGAVAATVVARRVFYNGSFYDKPTPKPAGYDSHVSDTFDDLAIAPDKSPLFPHQTATFANVTSFSQGITGVMIDVAALPGGGNPTVADFVFRVGNNNTPNTWAAGPAPANITVRRGAGIDGSDRITLTWPDHAIQNQWLQVSVVPNARTGLAQADTFYFGNAVGASGTHFTPVSTITYANVNAADEIYARNRHQPLGGVGVPLSTQADYNRDGQVSAVDDLIARNHPTVSVPTAPNAALQMISFDVAPTVSGPSGLSLVQGSSIDLVGANQLLLSDSDAGAANETLTMNVTSGLLFYNGGNMGTSLTLSGTVAHINSLLANSISYQAPANGSLATLTAVANDGVLAGPLFTLPIALLEDQAPGLTAPANLSVVQGYGIDLAGANRLAVSDADAGDKVETVTLNVTAGQLFYNGNNYGARLTLTGTIAQLNSQLASRVSYQGPTAGNSAVLTAVISDGVRTSPSVAVPITLLTDAAPQISGPSSLTVTQGNTIPLVFPNHIAFFDPDGDSGAESVTLDVTAGTLFYNGNNMGTRLTLTGSIPQINAALTAAVSYRAPAVGLSAVLTATANDGVRSSPMLQVPISLLANQRPTLVAPSGFSAVQGNWTDLTGALQFSVDDVDHAGNVESVTLNVSAGSLWYNGNNFGTRLVLTGNIPSLNTQLAASLAYRAPNNGGSVVLTAVANDGNLSSELASVPITVQSDAAPALTGPSSLSVSQGNTLKLSGLLQFSLSDVDHDDNIETVTFNVTSGKLLFNGNNFGTRLVLSGTVPQINSQLADSVSYQAPTTGSAATLTAVAHDGVLASPMLTVPITMPTLASSDMPPTITGPASLSVPQNNTIGLTLANRLTVADGDAGSTVETVTINVTTGTLFYNGGNNGRTLTLTGTIAQLNSQLATNLSYQAPANGAAAVITASVSDGVLTSSLLSIPIVIGADVAPSLSGPAGFNVTQGSRISLAGITLSDGDAGSNNETVVLNVTNGMLYYDNNNYGTSLTLTGGVSQINDQLANRVTYQAASTNLAAWLTVAANDGVLSSAILNLPLAVSADVAPSLTAPGGVSVWNGGEFVFTNPNAIVLTDPDAASSSETVTLTVTAGALWLNGNNYGTRLVLTGQVAQVNQQLSALRYRAPASGSSATLTVVANDGVFGGPLVTVPITLTSNAAPTIAGPANLSVSLGASIALIGGLKLVVADSDAGDDRVTVTINVTSGRLIYNNNDYGTNLVLVDTVANLNAALTNKLTYQAPANGSAATLTAVVNDGAVSGPLLSVAISLTANTAPSVTGPASLSATQGVAIPLTGANQFFVADADAGSKIETVTFNVTSGTLLYNGNNQGTRLVLSGTIAQLNTWLVNNLSYKPPANDSSATLSVVIDDGVFTSPLLNVPILLL